MNNYKAKSMLRYLLHRILINLIFLPTICPSGIFICPHFKEKSSPNGNFNKSEAGAP